MTKHLRNSLQSLREALKPLDVSDFLRQPAEYIALYTPICVPPMASRPGHGNLTKPFFSITYGECRTVHAALAEINKTLAQKTRGGETARLLAEQVGRLIDQMQEIKIYGDYLSGSPQYGDEDKAYHLTTFINDFTNSTPRQKSKYPEFSGTRRHTLTIGQLKTIVSAVRQIEATVHDESVVPFDLLSDVAELQPAL